MTRHACVRVGWLIALPTTGISERFGCSQVGRKRRPVVPGGCHYPALLGALVYLETTRMAGYLVHSTEAVREASSQGGRLMLTPSLTSRAEAGLVSNGVGTRRKDHEHDGGSP